MSRLKPRLDVSLSLYNCPVGLHASDKVESDKIDKVDRTFDFLPPAHSRCKTNMCLLRSPNIKFSN